MGDSMSMPFRLCSNITSLAYIASEVVPELKRPVENFQDLGKTAHI